MINPFELLKVSESASDEEVRAAYLARVREFPPERAPKQFQVIREAYDRIKTEKARIAYLYLDNPEIESEAIRRVLLGSQSPGRPDELQFKKMLSDTIHQIARIQVKDQ
ncbi:MAG: J domain-containing protein [Methylococcales bacterium]